LVAAKGSTERPESELKHSVVDDNEPNKAKSVMKKTVEINLGSMRTSSVGAPAQ